MEQDRPRVNRQGRQDECSFLTCTAQRVSSFVKIQTRKARARTHLRKEGALRKAPSWQVGTGRPYLCILYGIGNKIA